MMPLSNCCSLPCWISSSGEGTMSYCCTGCQQPCDGKPTHYPNFPLPEEIQEAANIFAIKSRSASFFEDKMAFEAGVFWTHQYLLTKKVSNG